MSGPNPRWQGDQGYTGHVYSEPPQVEETHQIQSYYDGSVYDQGHGPSRPYHDYPVEPAYSMGGGYYNSYNQHQYQTGNAPEYHDPSWRAGYDEHASAYGSAEPYGQEAYYDTSYNYRHRPYSARFQARGQQYPNAAPATPPPRSPSPTYISTSLSPSTSAETPSRKLLILDLNGTLLFRPKPVFQPRPQRPTPTATSEGQAISSHPFHPHSPAPFQPLKRTVYARPYLSCFREYIFYPSTRKWLDVMIWSSAQPHSVKDMLQRCFPVPQKGDDGDKDVEGGSENKSDGRFAAVWARDTLGLSSVDYSRKTQTTKDLHKPWSQLQPFQKCDPSSDTASLQEGESVTRHSAYTTLLLDDSPRKAHLQPWNHVCLKEYDVNMRDEDVKTLQTLRREPDVGVSRAEESEDIAKPATTPSDKLSTSHTIPASDSPSPPPPDPTLLAVIGVLEAIKYESNVAGWIRAGGLWADHRDETVQSGPVTDPAESNGVDSLPPAPLSTLPPASGIKRGRDTDDVDPRLMSPETEPTKRPRLGSPNTHTHPEVAHESGLKRTSCSPPPSSLPPPIPSPSLPPSLASGNDGGGVQKHDGDEPKNSLAHQPLWFSHGPTFEYWVSKGKETLRELKIEVEHGVTIDQEVEK